MYLYGQAICVTSLSHYPVAQRRDDSEDMWHHVGASDREENLTVLIWGLVYCTPTYVSTGNALLCSKL